MSAELDSRLSALLRDNAAISQNRADKLVSVILAFVDADRARNEPTRPSPVPAQTGMSVLSELRAMARCASSETKDRALDLAIHALEEIAAVEASAGDGLTDEQIENVLETAREYIVEGFGYKYNEQDLLAAIRSLAASHIKAGGQVGSSDKLRERVLEAWENYERMGEVCSFEGNPMIYASTLEELATIVKDAIEGKVK